MDCRLVTSPVLAVFNLSGGGGVSLDRRSGCQEVFFGCTRNIGKATVFSRNS